MKLLRNTKDQNGETVNHLEINEVVIVYCNIAKIVNYRLSTRFKSFTG